MLSWCHVREGERRCADQTAVEKHLRTGRARQDLQQSWSGGRGWRFNRRRRLRRCSLRRCSPWGGFRRALWLSRLTRHSPGLSGGFRRLLDPRRRSRRSIRTRHDLLRLEADRAAHRRLGRWLLGSGSLWCGCLCRRRWRTRPRQTREIEEAATGCHAISAHEADPDADDKTKGRNKPDRQAARTACLGLDRGRKQLRLGVGGRGRRAVRRDYCGIRQLWLRKAIARQRRGYPPCVARTRRFRLPQRKVNERIVWSVV